MAFAELGKTGYKIELSETVLEKDGYPNPVISYWQDKVFPNEKDADGNITKWLTPWCYEIRMDWRDYPDEERNANKVYNDARVSAWVLDNNDKPTEIIPQAYEPYKEKERLV